MVKPLEMIADGVDLLDGDRKEVGGPSANSVQRVS
jgi:hypothetical protein